LFESYNGISSRDLPIGVEFCSSDDYYYDDSIHDGFENRYYSLVRVSEEEFRVTVFTSYSNYRSLDFGCGTFIYAKKKLTLQLAGIKPKVEYEDYSSNAIAISFEVIGNSFEEMISFAANANKAINNQILDAVKSVPDQIRKSLGLDISNTNSQNPIPIRNPSLKPQTITYLDYEICVLGIDFSLVNNPRVVVSVEYPSEYWLFDMKVEWFMIFKAELLHNWSLFSQKIEKNDLIGKKMVFSVAPPSGTDAEKIQYAKTLNLLVNDLLIEESQKINSYIKNALSI
jgi:hypothetical protein